MSTYLAYVSGGKCRDTHAPTKDDEGKVIKAPLIHRQFWVVEELRRMGIEAWCGKRIDFKRLGKSRTAEGITSPALPGYLFIDMSHERMFEVTSVDHIAPTLQLLSRQDLDGAPGKPGLNEFKAAAEADFKAAERVDGNKRADVAEYVKGQRLRIMSGPFMDMFATYEKMVRAPDVGWQKVSASVEGIGGIVTFDPLDVKRA